MPGQTVFANINTCQGQKDSFVLRFTPSQGQSLTGCAVKAVVLSAPGSTTILMTPTVGTVMDGVVLEATFSWTQEQSAALPVIATTGGGVGGAGGGGSLFPIQVGLAFPDDPTHAAMRFTSKLAVSPGSVVSFT